MAVRTLTVRPPSEPALEVSVVLPCLDEAGSIGHCVHEAREALAALDAHGEVIVVDNGSTDGSATIAAEAGARVVPETRRGYGRAIRSGIEAASGEVVVVADADMTYDLARLGDLVEPVRNGDADLMLGSRRAGANRHTMPVAHRFVGTPVLNFLIRRATGGAVVVEDSQSGFRAMRRDRLLDLDLHGTGMELASEMLIKAAWAHLRIAEVSTGYRERVGSSKLRTVADGGRHLREIAFLVSSRRWSRSGSAS